MPGHMSASLRHSTISHVAQLARRHPTAPPSPPLSQLAPGEAAPLRLLGRAAVARSGMRRTFYRLKVLGASRTCPAPLSGRRAALGSARHGSGGAVSGYPAAAPRPPAAPGPALSPHAAPAGNSSTRGAGSRPSQQLHMALPRCAGVRRRRKRRRRI